MEKFKLSKDSFFHTKVSKSSQIVSHLDDISDSSYNDQTSEVSLNFWIHLYFPCFIKFFN